MQNPHCAAPVSRNASWSGSRRSPAASPSTVVTAAPSASTPSIRHESTLSPSTMTVHAPHSPTRQHSFVPVSPRSSRSISRSVWCGSTSTVRPRPLTVSSMRVVTTAIRSRASRTARIAITRSIARRYSGLARIDVGDGAAATNSSSRRSRTASSVAVGSASVPVSSTARTGRGPTLPYETRVVPLSSIATASVTDARSWPRRRVRRAWTDPRAPVGRGISIASTSSPRASVVTPERTKKSSSGMTRRPPCPTAMTRAPKTSSAGAVSAAGEALQMFPASVARFRIWTEPTYAAASASAV